MSLQTLSCAVVLLLSLVSLSTSLPMLVGGLSSTKPADAHIGNLVNKVKAEFEAKTNQECSVFLPVSYRQQLVNGMNYFVKVKTGLTTYAHLRIYESFDRKTIELANFEQNHSQDDTIGAIDSVNMPTITKEQAEAIDRILFPLGHKVIVQPGDIH